MNKKIPNEWRTPEQYKNFAVHIGQILQVLRDIDIKLVDKSIEIGQKELIQHGDC